MNFEKQQTNIISREDRRESLTSSLDFCAGIRCLDVVLSIIGLVLLCSVFIVQLARNFLSNKAGISSVVMVGLHHKPVPLFKFFWEEKPGLISQLYRVLKGELSLVGPRLLDRHESRSVPAESQARFLVLPGVVSPYGLKKATGMDREDEWTTDLQFVQTRTFRSVIGILIRSIFVHQFIPNRDASSLEDFQIFGVGIDNTTVNDELDEIVTKAEGFDAVNIAFVNADNLNKAYRDREYTDTLQRFDKVYADGSGVRMAASMKHYRVQENINGTDLFPKLCQKLAGSDHSIYLLGAKQGVAEVVAKKMAQRYPGLKVVGTHHGYFSADEDEAVITAINRSGATILIVAFGSPLQEKWIRKCDHLIQANIRIGVGGLFDFYSDRVSRSPLWLREMGLEWVWRLKEEPKRMWRRHLIGNPLFLYRAWKDSQLAKSGSSENQVQVMEHLKWVSKIPWLYRIKTRAVQQLCNLKPIYSSWIKRVLDLMIATTALLLLSPLMLVTATAIKIDSRGKVFFSQIRIGKNGVPFRFWKFRSMCSNAESKLAQIQQSNEMDGGVLFKIKDDPRVTRVGRFIRKYSIDELPQLWNVIIGDMSLVGPRPCLESELDQYSVSDLKRLDALPGITGEWQTSGRSNSSFREQMDLDINYVYERNILGDIQILLKTIPVVVSGEGAY